jgi:hypothetical protein
MRPLEAPWTRSGHPAAQNPLALHVQNVLERAEADLVHVARDMATMFDELKAMAELHAAQTRLQAELERERAELIRARRPWWRRLIGR